MGNSADLCRLLESEGGIRFECSVLTAGSYQRRFAWRANAGCVFQAKSISMAGCNRNAHLTRSHGSDSNATEVGSDEGSLERCYWHGNLLAVVHTNRIDSDTWGNVRNKESCCPPRRGYNQLVSPNTHGGFYSEEN